MLIINKYSILILLSLAITTPPFYNRSEENVSKTAVASGSLFQTDIVLFTKDSLSKSVFRIRDFILR